MRFYEVYATATPESAHRIVTGHALWLFIYFKNHIDIAQLMKTSVTVSFLTPNQQHEVMMVAKQQLPYYAPVIPLA